MLVCFNTITVGGMSPYCQISLNVGLTVKQGDSGIHDALSLFVHYVFLTLFND